MYEYGDMEENELQTLFKIIQGHESINPDLKLKLIIHLAEERRRILSLEKEVLRLKEGGGK